MKVSELINRLSDLNQDAEVIVSGYEGGVKSVKSIDRGILSRNVNTEWYYGEHEIESAGGEDYDAVHIY